jgi:hypothetical protein
MMYMITGKIGGGKTLFALTQILDLLCRGGCVVSNIALEPRGVDAAMRRRGRRLVEGQIREYDFESEPEFQGKIPWGVPGCPVSVFVDEAQLYYNATQARTLEARLMRLISFLTQSRKASVDVWFITQHDTTIWAQFRHQCLFGYKCRDMRAVSLPFIGRVGSLGLVWVKYDIISGETMESGKTPLSKTLFDCYNTRQMYDSHMTELQAAAEIWQPVKKGTKGIYETRDHSSTVHRRPLLGRIFNLAERGEAEDRSRDSDGSAEA